MAANISAFRLSAFNQNDELSEDDELIDDSTDQIENGY